MTNKPWHEEWNVRKVEAGENTSYLLDAVKEIAEKLGMKEPPTIWLSNGKNADGTLNKYLYHPNALAIGNNIVLTESLLETYGDSGLEKPISNKLKFILGHEMYHNKHFNIQTLAQRTPIYALPAIAVASLFLYDQTFGKKEDDIKNIEQNYQQAKAGIETMPANSEQEQISQQTQDLIFNAGRYLAVAAAGAVFGVYTRKLSSRYSEFAADSFGAQIAGKEASKEALNSLYEAAKKAAEEATEFPKMKIGEAIDYLTSHNHPSLPERIANISR